MLSDLALMVQWSTAVALETAYASSTIGISSPSCQDLENALDALHEDCSVQAFFLGWGYTDLPLPYGPLP